MPRSHCASAVRDGPARRVGTPERDTHGVMTETNQLGMFLRASRARVTPEQAGMTLYGDNRRVAGLRREELAMLAGVSV